jgi:hypothetical protein
VKVTILNEWDQLKKVWNYLDENLKKEFIKSSKLLTDYSILFVLKKDDKKQLCIELSTTQQITRQDSYFLSLIEELQDWLDKVCWFMSLNLKDIYYQVRMKEDKEWKWHSDKIWTLWIHCHVFELKMFLSSFKD